jgi:hypothetical protein
LGTRVAGRWTPRGGQAKGFCSPDVQQRTARGVFARCKTRVAVAPVNPDRGWDLLGGQVVWGVWSGEGMLLEPRWGGGQRIMPCA